MSVRSLTELEIRNVIEGQVVIVPQGQVPRNGDILLFEKEYTGRAVSSPEEALRIAVEVFEKDRRGEKAYVRSVTIFSDSIGHVAVVAAALRVTPLDFAQAFNALKKGAQVRRFGWNGAGQCVYLERFADFDVSFEPCFVLLNAQGKLQPGWVPSMGDMMAEDWEILP
jgi:hypothetical protein